MSFIDQKAENTAIDLIVEAAGMDITVKAGSFQVIGEELELDDDVVFSVQTKTNNVWIDASLVRVIASGEITVLVDEREADGVTFDLPFEFEGSPYERLHSIYSIGIPAGTTDLGGLDLQVNRVVIPLPPAALTPSAKVTPTTPEAEPMTPERETELVAAAFTDDWERVQ